MAYVLHRTPCCRSIWESRHNKGGNKNPFFMKITYLGDGLNPVNFILKLVDFFGDTYNLDESSINKMILDGTEIKFEDLTLANKGEYGGTIDIYTYIFNDTNEHELIIYSDSKETLRFAGWTGGPGNPSDSKFNIKSVDINNVTTIGSHAFYNCTNLISVTIPNSVTSIGERAFKLCSGLTSIISLATTAPTISSDTFQDINADGTLTVPTGSTLYDVWMGTGNYYLGKYNWTKVEQ